MIVQAEDRCRAEAFERTRRMLTKAVAAGRLPMGLEFDPNAPWTGVFIYAARDTEFWNKHVVRPSAPHRPQRVAHSYIARGGATYDCPEGGERQRFRPCSASSSRSHGSWLDQPFRSLTKGAQEEKAEGAWGAWRSRRSSGQDQKKWGTHFITDYDGIEICFKYAKGAPGACSEPCPSQRSHSCQHCLGRHTNDLCPTHVKKDGKGNTKGNSPKKSPGK